MNRREFISAIAAAAAATAVPGITYAGQPVYVASPWQEVVDVDPLSGMPRHTWYARLSINDVERSIYYSTNIAPMAADDDAFMAFIHSERDRHMCNLLAETYGPDAYLCQ